MAEELKPVGFGMEKEYGDCVSFLGRRQQHIHFMVTCAMSFVPARAETAGIAVIQAYNHQYRLERSAVDQSGSPGQEFSFLYGEDVSRMQILAEGLDGRVINPEIVGGMMGTILGMFASGNHAESEKEAAFDWFQYKEWKEEVEE